MLDYLALAAVAAVLREGSFEKAASVLGVTPSAVSQRVKGLEERLGATLLTRGTPCLPTPIGAKLHAHIERVRLLEADISDDLQGLAGAGETAPTLRVQCAPIRWYWRRAPRSSVRCCSADGRRRVRPPSACDPAV